MDLEKILTLVSKFGVVPAGAIYFIFKLQAFMEALITQQATMIELLRQLIEMHRK